MNECNLRIVELIKTNTMLYAVYSEAKKRGWSYERFLETAVVVLAETNRQLLTAVEGAILQKENQ